MRFLIDRCAGLSSRSGLVSRGTTWLRRVTEGPDPGDHILLSWAAQESRILVTIDTDFGQLVFVEGLPHSGLVRLPDVPSKQRLEIIKELIERFHAELESRAIITVRGGKIRISQSP